MDPPADNKKQYNKKQATKFQSATEMLQATTREQQILQGAAEITPTFWRSIKIKRNKVHKKFFYL